MALTLLDLPPELLIHIFAYLPIQCLISLLRTSQAINELVSTSTLLQYLICLGSSSYSSYPTAIPTSKNLMELKQREKGWSEWNVQNLTHLEVNHRPSGIYDLTCGVFLLGEAGSGRNTNALRWVDLGQGKHLQWHRLDLQARIVDLALNVHEWDLIAVVTTKITTPGTYLIELNLLQLSASRESVVRHHPMALQPVMPIITYPSRHGNCSLSMEIVGTYLALLIIFPYSIRPVDKLYVFDWKTGKLLFTRQAERLTYCSLGFLSEDVIMLPNLPQNSIELCSLSQSRTMSVSPATTFLDDCQQLHTDFPNAIPLRTTVILQLPLLAPEMQVARIACRGEPTPYSSTFDPTQDQIGRPFRPQAESSIIVFNVLLEDDIPMQFGRLKTLSFAIHRYALLAQVDAHRNRQYHPSPSNEVTDGVPWNEWGPDITRWFSTDDIPTRWITTSCGQRWATIDEELPSPICIRDFNSINIKRVIESLGGTRSYETDNAIITVVDTPSSASEENERTFGEQVESRLPYLEIITKNKFKYSSVFMDEGWLLGIVLDETEHNISQVDIFSMT